MSRIGRMPITVPAGVEVNVGNDNVVTVKGPLGTLTQKFQSSMKISVANGEVTVERPSDENQHKSLHGLTRTLVSNMITGVKTGYTKVLEINGVGYKAQKQGTNLVLNLGHSHPIIFAEENGITFEVPSPTVINVKGINNVMVGQIAATIRSKRPPEPYLGKGVKYKEEKIRRKAGKTGK